MFPYTSTLPKIEVTLCGFPDSPMMSTDNLCPALIAHTQMGQHRATPSFQPPSHLNYFPLQYFLPCSLILRTPTSVLTFHCSSRNKDQEVWGLHENKLCLSLTSHHLFQLTSICLLSSCPKTKLPENSTV